MSTSIIHLPYNHGNFIGALQRAERDLGATSKLVAVRNPFVDVPDITLSDSRLRRLKTLKAFWLARKCDIVAYNFGSSLYDTTSRHQFLLDLPFYPKSQKKMMFFQGSDARLQYGATILESREFEISLGAALGKSTKDGFISNAEVDLKLRRFQKISEHVDRIFYFNPDLAKGLPSTAKFFPYPFFFDRNEYSTEQILERPLRVLHLSTNRVLKGTGLIEKALMTAQLSINIEYKVKVRVTRKEAQQALRWTDVLIDQVGLGWYGMQAVEALSKGKVVLCSIDRLEWARHLPDYVDKPSGIIHCSHNEIPDVLFDLKNRPDVLNNLKMAGPNFVNDIHDPLKLTKTFYGDWINGQG